MRVLLQRVKSAEVFVDDEKVASIAAGLLLFVSFARCDDEEELMWMAKKVTRLRVFPDASGRTNKSLHEISGSLLVVPQFTLHAEVGKGLRPSFTAAAPPGFANEKFSAWCNHLTDTGLTVAKGIFGADMLVTLVNHGPFTIWLEREKKNIGAATKISER